MSSPTPDRSGGTSQDPSALDDRYAAELDPAARHLQAPRSDLERLLAPMQAKEVPLPLISGLLQQTWSQLQALRRSRAELSEHAAGDAELAGAIEQAFEALQSGERFSLEEADRAFQRAYEHCRAKSGSAELTARVRAAQAQIAALDLENLRAAERYEEAAAVPGLSAAQQWRYRLQQALALEEQGRACLDTTALQRAVELYENHVLPLAPRDERPQDWAATQHHYGNALTALGQRQLGTRRLDEAVEAYRQALAERTRERAPLEWAATQDSLGTTLGLLAQRCADEEKLEESIEAFQAALQERTEALVPDDWAKTQNRLGTALLTLGRRRQDKVILRQAADAYKNVLKVWTRDHVPLPWAATMDNLGMALRLLGEHRKGPRTLEQSVAAYRSALRERTRERVPQSWAMTQNNLGAALHKLGERQQDPEALEAAIEAYGNALKEWTRETVPMTWAMTMANLCAARKTLAELLEDVELVRQVHTDFRAVAEVFRNASHAQYYELVTEQIALTRKLEQRLVQAQQEADAPEADRLSS